MKLLQFWLSSQSLHVGWDGSLLECFYQKNGIRQGSILSPYLFNVYIDLNHDLQKSRVGCQVGDIPTNNFSYADDLDLIALSAAVLNNLLKICNKFASEHNVIFSNTKSVCMHILPNWVKLTNVQQYILGRTYCNL